jgi:hypothetical protein
VDEPLAVFAKTILHDTPSEIAVFVQPGSPAKVRDAVLGGTAELGHRPVVALREGWVDRTWVRWRLLTFKRPRDEHSISLAWHDDTGRFAHWYIDLTSPLRRRAFGFDLVENGLDVVVEPDMSSWQFKDEAELEWAVAHETYTRAEADALYAEGRRAVERLLRERSDFERWIDWRPDPTWPQPTLPVGWDAA